MLRVVVRPEAGEGSRAAYDVCRELLLETVEDLLEGARFDVKKMKRQAKTECDKWVASKRMLEARGREVSEGRAVRAIASRITWHFILKIRIRVQLHGILIWICPSLQFDRPRSSWAAWSRA